MTLRINFNDAWESVPYEFSDELSDYIISGLQPSHPLRNVKFDVIGRLWRSEKYLLESQDAPYHLWHLDMSRRMRVSGKSFRYCKEVLTQGDLDEILESGLKWWVQYMKDVGAWNA